MTETLQAIGNSVIVKPIYTPQERDSGLILPANSREFKQYHNNVYGEVVSIGRDYTYRHCIKPGDKLVFQRHEGKPIEYQGKKYLKLREAWIHATVS